MAAPTRRPSRRRPPPRLMLLTATAAALLALAAAAADPPSSSSPAPLPPPYPPLPPPDANANATASASSSPPPPFSFAPEIGTGPGGVVYGTVQIVAVHGPMVPGTEVEHEHQPFVSVRGTGEMRRLLFPPQRAAESGGGSSGGNEARVPPTGSLVMVKAAPMSRCVKPGTPVDGNPVCVHAMMAHESGAVNGFAAGQPRGEVTVKAIVFLLDACGSGPAAAARDIERVLFADTPNAYPYTVQGMMRACSYGAANFTRAGGVVVEPRVVPLPCSGYTPSGTFYDSKTCPFNEWSDVANLYIRNTLRIRLEDYQHKIYVTPKGGVCRWGGMGYVGCHGDCRVWVSGDVWDRAATYAHEIGHNLYLNHAGSKGDNGYGDFSATMGYCCDVRCYNPPHMWQMGWATALAPALTASSFPEGTWQRHSLPAQITTSKNYLRVRPDWTDISSIQYNFYFSYRKRLGYDSGLSVARGFADRVAVYSTRVGDPQPYTSHEVSVAQGETWREPRLGTGLVARFEKVVGNSAVVALCRPSVGQSRGERDCADGLDNDCDGVVDGQDSDCGGGGGGGVRAPPGATPPLPPTTAPRPFTWWRR